ncbi:hypothetical protein BFP72_07535 [Reichenbachiella sp. 5M10]|uniref:hypothetical protein n=1 Tax=Reichenbachiella sp. 5M10 TaxID=1889772 RepID=UPI000C1565AC|nr:hypothetical protein [Reichenbachiella sp. 5M10]PIB35258.1 hypothetical protein BFP72_07535 [Reichenbachiella sp. 5M10]
MFTEFEIETLIEIEEVKQATVTLREEFVKKEAPYLEISTLDFFSLVMMTPTVGIALANGSVSLWEEMSLNRKARKLSQGGGFLKKDPVSFALKFLIKKYDFWELKFLAVIRLAMEASFDIGHLEQAYDQDSKVTLSQYRREVLHAPYIFIRFLSSFFLEDDERIISPRDTNAVDHARLQEIGKKLGLHKIPLFHYFCATFEVE